MLSEKALKSLYKLCSHCEKSINQIPTNHTDIRGSLIGCGFEKKRCPFRSIDNDYCPEFEDIKNALLKLFTYEKK